jgi:hypothetical protein
MMRKLVYAWAAIDLLGAVTIAVTGLVLWSKRFISRLEPSRLESSVAMKAYDSSVPNRFVAMRNPWKRNESISSRPEAIMRSTVPSATPITVAASRSFTASCIPVPPTCALTTPKNVRRRVLLANKHGFRCSGMPAFGKPGDDDEHVWKIVAYVRYLPKLTSQEEKQITHHTEESIDHGESSDDNSN